MAPLVLFTDATALTIDYLRSELAAVFGELCPVVEKVPNPRPARFVQVLRTGGPRLDFVRDGAQITVDSWGQKDETAHDLAQRARALINAMGNTVQDEVTVYRVEELAGPGNLPDPLSNHSRYRQSFIVAIRGAGVNLTSS